MSATPSDRLLGTGRKLIGCVLVLLPLAIVSGSGFLASRAAADSPGRYLDVDEFLHLAFGEAPPEAEVLWLDKEMRDSLGALLGHSYRGLRIRYWQNGDRTAWILDEIGKEQPITTGVVVHAGSIELVRILEFREVRGWEVRYPFFTDQFRGSTLTGERDLSGPIDGITGATLSVRAVKGVARVALYLHEQVME